MKRLYTDFEPADRVLNFLVEYRKRLPVGLQDDWLAGHIGRDLNYRFIGHNTSMLPEDIPTVIAYLHCAGYVKADPDRNHNHSVRLSLNLPAGAAAA